MESRWAADGGDERRIDNLRPVMTMVTMMVTMMVVTTMIIFGMMTMREVFILIVESRKLPPLRSIDTWSVTETSKY